MPANAGRPLVGQDVKRAANDERLGDSGPDRDARPLGPRQNRLRRLALRAFSGSRLNLIFDGLEHQLPLLHELPVVAREIADKQEVLPEPSRPLLERAIEVADRSGDPDDLKALSEGVGSLLEARLKDVSAVQPQYAAVLRAYHAAEVAGDHALSEGLIAWLMGQPNVSADIKKHAGIKGEIDHTGALGFLRGMLAVLQQCGRPGLLLVLDEVETIQRVRSDSRDRSLEAIRKLIDDLYGGRFAGLYILITGTPAFFDGPNGVKRLPPLAQRLHVDFTGDAKWDNPRDVQVRLFPFDQQRLIEVGRRVRDLYPTEHADRMKMRVTDAVLTGLANEVAGKLGGKVGVAPRIFLRKLVATILDRVDLFPDFDPAKDLDIRIEADELTLEEQAAAAGKKPDDIELDL